MLSPDTRTLAFDPWMGASGDMLLGALLDLGADATRLEPIELAIDVTFEVEHTTLAGLASVDVTVATTGDDPHRSPDAIITIIESMDLDASVRTAAIETVERLAEAEARVHGVSVDEVHFHEVGADDAIADICGTHALLDDLEVDRVVTAPVAAGSGTVDMVHGTYPVPPPAVTTLAETAGWTIQPGPIEGELLTPTGAALLTTIATGVEQLPAMHLEATGYGAGDRRFPDRPNVLRALLGMTIGSLAREEICVLETIVDDVTPETIGSLHETLAEAGALDVAALPATMKQSRPGHLIQVVVREADAAAVAKRLATETGTLGVRELPVTHRFVANRRIETVEIEIGGHRYCVDVKLATDQAGACFDVSTEDADARSVARQAGVPVRTVRRLAESAVELD